jgi:ATP-dependent RNA helicase DeaD
MEEIDPRTLVRLLLARTEHGGPCEPRAVTPITPAGRREGPAMSRGQKRAATEAGGFVPFRINWGEAEGADKRRILALVCRRGRVTGDQIGAIRVGREGSSFDVAAASAEMFAAAAKRYDPRNPELRIEPDRRGDRPAQAEAHERRAPRAPAQAEERAEHRDSPREHAPKDRAEPRERAKEHHAPRERAEPRERTKEHHAPRERAEPRERTKEHHAPRERAEHRPPERSEAGAPEPQGPARRRPWPAHARLPPQVS